MARRADPDARSRLLAACRAAFAQAGVDGARVEDIARAAGVSKGAFYLHFDSKEAAVAALVADFFAVMGDLSQERQEAQAELRARIGAPTPEDWRYRTPRLLRYAEVDHEHTVRTLKAMWRHRDVLRMILESAGPQRADLVDRFLELARRDVTSELEAAMCHGGLRDDLDRELVSELLLGMYLQLGRRMVRSESRPDLERWARTVSTLIMEGLARREADADLSVSQGAK